jgi:N-acyl-D-amino-acid deacylase
LSGYLVLLAVLGMADPAPVEADVVIENLTLYDGSGGGPAVGDLAIKADRIAAIGRFQVRGTPLRLEGRGLVAAPGFIDLHTHSDEALQEPRTRANLCYLMQGVTTVVTGNCGSGPVDVAAYYQALQAGGVGTNVLHLVPHNDLRRRVMGNVNRPPRPTELAQMERLVEAGMNAGAWGLSTGLTYNPGTYARTDELVALARVAGRNGGLYASHLRDEGTGLLLALEEALTIGRHAGLPVHVSHLKAAGRKAWGTAADAVALIEKARKAGQAVTADQYPYTASSTTLSATLVPASFREGQRRDFLARLQDPQLGPQIMAAVAQRLAERDDGRALRVAAFAAQPAWQGKDLQTLARLQQTTPLQVALEIERHGGASVIDFCMAEEDVALIRRQPWVATASDGLALLPGASGLPHPRSHGCFARQIGRLAFGEKLLLPQQAIRSATGLPADILRLKDRGYLKIGYHADVVIFDPKQFRDRATYAAPYELATGVRWLFVNGHPVLRDGSYTGALRGRALRHPWPP